MTWRQSLLMGAGILLLGIVVYLIQSPYRDITTAPVEQARESAPLDPALSYISIPVTLPLSAIQAYANREIPEELVRKTENKKFKVRFLGIPTTIKGKVETVVLRTGPVQVSTHDDWLELSIPLWFRATMDGKGTFDPDARTKGAVTITTRFRLGIDEQWQAQLDAKAAYKWNNKPHLSMGHVHIRVDNLIGRELEDRLDEYIIKLKDKVRNDVNLRSRAAARWHELHQVRPFSDSLGAWLVINPQAAYFTPIRYTAEALIIEFGLAAYLHTVVGNVPAPPVPEPLPDLIVGDPPQNGFSLQLPMRFSYAAISKRLNSELAGKEIALDYGSLTPREFRLYASENSLVVAARISAKAPNRLLNTHGWIYLTGVPRYDAEKRMLFIEELDFSRHVDNILVSSASWVLQDTLRDRISRSLQFDMNERIEKLRTSANERINHPLGEGFTLGGELQDLNLAYLIPQQEDLLLVLNAHGHLAITSTLGELNLGE